MILSMCSTFARWFNAHLSWVFNFEIAIKKCDYCVDDENHDCVFDFVLNHFRNVVRATTNRFATHSNSRAHVLILRVVFFQWKKNNRNDWRVFFIENTINNSTNNVNHRNNRFRNRRNRRNIFVVFCFCFFFFCVSSIFFFLIFVERFFEHCF